MTFSHCFRENSCHKPQSGAGWSGRSPWLGSGSVRIVLPTGVFHCHLGGKTGRLRRSSHPRAELSLPHFQPATGSDLRDLKFRAGLLGMEMKTAPPPPPHGRSKSLRRGLILTAVGSLFCLREGESRPGESLGVCFPASRLGRKVMMSWVY